MTHSVRLDDLPSGTGPPEEGNGFPAAPNASGPMAAKVAAAVVGSIVQIKLLRWNPYRTPLLSYASP